MPEVFLVFQLLQTPPPSAQRRCKLIDQIHIDSNHLEGHRYTDIHSALNVIIIYLPRYLYLSMRVF